MGTITSERAPARSGHEDHGKHARHDGKRADVQGLRMVAVLAVVANHLTGHPRGAFVGVDVFFVISGFLITSLLLRSAEREVSLGSYVVNFYRRRIRRLLPAALVVTALTVVAARLLLNTARYRETWHDAVWSTFFSINWHLAGTGTDYFSQGAPPSPFQHYWSLSVEEQFYLVWPVLVFVAGVILVGSRRNGRLAAAGMALTLCVVSLAWGAMQSQSNPSYAYFSSFTRAWELGLGALLACLAIRVPTRLLTPLSWLGLATIAVSCFTVSGGAGFPVPGALLPCLGSALVLAATNDEASAFNPVLTNPVSVFVGDISYSVYLVHFPVIVLLSARMLDHTWYFYAIACLLIAGLSIGLYAFVEQPVLRSAWLLPSRRRRRNVLVGADPRYPIYGLVTVATVVVSLVLLVFWQTAQTQAAIDRQASISAALGDDDVTTSTVASPRTREADRLHRAIVAAVKSDQWPSGLSPGMDQMLASPLFSDEIGRCGNAVPAFDDCTFGRPAARHTIELVGDSMSIAWVATFRAFVADHPDWKVRVGGGYACVFADKLIVTGDADFSSHCMARLGAVVDDIKTTRPDLLVVSNRWTRPTDLDSTQRELDKVASSVGHVVMISAPPPVTDPHACYHPGGSPSDCLSKLPSETPEVIDNEQSMVDAFGGTVIDTTGWFCAGGYGPEFVGTTPTYFDDGHITPAYGTTLGPVLTEALTNAHLLSGKAQRG